MKNPFKKEFLPSIQEMDNFTEGDWVKFINDLFENPPNGGQMIPYALSQYSRVTNDRAAKRMLSLMWVTLAVAIVALVVSMISIFGSNH